MIFGVSLCKEIYNVTSYFENIVLDIRRGNCILKYWLLC
jgi:hypothetical protein